MKVNPLYRQHHRAVHARAYALALLGGKHAPGLDP